MRIPSPSNLSRLVAVIAAVLVATLACSFVEDETSTPEVTAQPIVLPTVVPGPDVPTSPASPPIDAPPVGSETGELARATVQIRALVPSGGGFDLVWFGSGSIITPDGLILTNGHVVDDRFDEYTDLGVAITERTDQPPELLYLAVIAAVDYDLDLAVLRIVSDVSGNPVTVNLPFVGLGDSDATEIGDKLRILGFPAIGGATITFTEGALSGFTSERGISGRAWIKTDATISGGNSGGMGVNDSGELIGVPTQASAGNVEGDIVDCRSVVDTNRDGILDENDTCVPIGGFINGLRPVNLALPLVEAAKAGQHYVQGIGQESAPPGGYDTSDTDFWGLVFSDGVTQDDYPTNLVSMLPAGSTVLCAFWDYEGMSDGMTYSAFWFINGTLSEGGSYLEEIWSGGASGNWWVCTTDDSGLPEGLYELVLEVEGEVLVNDTIYVGEGRTRVDYNLVNGSSLVLCFVFLSPTDASNWGQDELGSTEVIQAGQTLTIPAVTGMWDMLVLDCDAEVLLEEYGMDIQSDFTFTVPD